MSDTAADAPTLVYESSDSGDLGPMPRSVALFAAVFGLMPVVYIPWMFYVLKPLDSYQPTFRFTYWPVVSGSLVALCGLLLAIAAAPAVLGRSPLRTTASAALLVMIVLNLADLLWPVSVVSWRNPQQIAYELRGAGYRIAVAVAMIVMLALFRTRLTRAQLWSVLRLAFALLLVSAIVGTASEIAVYALHWSEVQQQFRIPQTLADLVQTYTLVWSFVLPVTLLPACLAGGYFLLLRRQVPRALDWWMAIPLAGAAFSLAAAFLIAIPNSQWVLKEGFLEAFWLPISIVNTAVTGHGVALLLLLTFRHLRRHAVGDFS